MAVVNYTSARANRSPITAAIPPTTVTPRVKLKGSNITLKPGYDSGVSGPLSYWRDLIYGEAWDWTDWIKWQVDLAIDAGCNAIRMMGAADGVAVGTYSRATYLGQVAQLADYCEANGLFFYPNIAANFGTPRNQAMVDEAVATAVLLDAYPNVVGIDIFNEWNAWMSYLGISTQPDRVIFKGDMVEIFNAIRSAGVTVPLTISANVGTDNFGGAASYFTEYVDFFDVHYYGDPPAAAYNSIASMNKPLVIGEFGAPMSVGEAARQSRYTSTKVVHDVTACGGSFSWAITDQNTNANDKWGMFDIDGVRRADVAAIWDSFSTSF